MSNNENYVCIFNEPLNNGLKCATFDSCLGSDISRTRVWYDRIGALLSLNKKDVRFKFYINDIEVSTIETALENVLFIDCDEIERALKEGRNYGF
jgi:hypothetical protein